MDPLFVQHSLLSLGLGFMIGLQREMHLIYTHKAKDFGGARTFAMIALFGYLSAWLSVYSPYFLIISAAIAGLLLIAAYIVNSMSAAEKGATTEFAALITYISGIMLHFVSPLFPVFIIITVLFLLNIKEKIQEYEQTIAKQDLSAAILFMMMTFVILPILADETIDPWGMFNLYRIWIMVVLVAGISFFGYIAIRFLGTSNGIGLAGLFGGLVSSTAVAMSMARRLHENATLVKNLAIGITLASSMMLIRAGIETLVINPRLFEKLLIPIIIGSLSGFAYIGYLYFTSRREKIDQKVEFKNPFDLKEALLMGLVFGATLALISIADDYAGKIGVYAVSVVSGLADVDAIILSLSSLANNGLDDTTAFYGILIAIATNSLMKALLVLFFGDKKLFMYVFNYYLISIGTFGLTAVLFSN